MDRAAIEVARRGGREATVLAVWRTITTNPGSLGGSRGSEPITGHVCPSCADAIHEEGTVGPSARGRAVVAHVGISSKNKAKHLRSLLSDGFPPTLPAWGGLPFPRVPNSAPWGHLSRVIDRL